ncbi:S1 RNA-binding domain-containing protein [Paenibacillus tepidiphilus]|uniref:S1 RNA-binding domain-containing protein n=1 Tax=Paenibacillus tepidiphilus TaxID=2608683 RepID=UPI00123AC0DF|nr:S1 RNA-binding domain-containing protein [Paenibacillus tepidiphilus]
MSSQAAVMELLQESMEKRYVQTGIVEKISQVKIRNETEELILINFNGVTVYCRKEEFIKREIKSFSGFLQTPVPFLVKRITPEGNVIVSRTEALPWVARNFIRNYSVGDFVTGTVSGVTENNMVFVDVSGVPCIIPPQEWSQNRPMNLREFLRVGTELELKILSIDELKKEPVDGEESTENVTTEFGYRVRLSRKAILDEEKEKIWDKIEEYYNPGDTTVAKVTGYASGQNSFFLELPKGLVILGNLQSNLRRQYGGTLPLGLKVHVNILRMDKATRRGKAKIFKVDPTLQSTLRKPYAFDHHTS